MKGNRILSIDPGTRELGVAVLANGELIYYGVKAIRRRKRPQDICIEAVRVVRQLIAEYEPRLFAIKQPIIIQRSAETLAEVIRDIKQAAQQEGLFVYEYAPKIVHQFVCGTGKATKRQAAERIASRYEELARYLKHRSEWETLYYAKLFEAVGVGLTCYSQQKDK